MAPQNPLLHFNAPEGTVTSMAIHSPARDGFHRTVGWASDLNVFIGPARDSVSAEQAEVLGRRLNRWKEASRRYARRLAIVDSGPRRAYWVNRFLRAATKAGRAAANYFDRTEAGLEPLKGPCFGPWCSPPVSRPRG